MFNVRKFGAYISKLRKQADMTQSVLGDKLNVTRQAVSRYENGESFPDISILVLIAETFGISVDDLINAGQPTKTEAILLQSDINKSEISKELFKEKTLPDDILNIASFLKPSLLDKIVKGFEKHDIDISKLKDLAEYLSDDTFISILENASFDTLDKDILEKFVPFLDDNSRGNIFKQIIDGELNYNFLELLIPYIDAYYLREQVEAAVIYGVLPDDALRVISRYNNT